MEYYQNPYTELEYIYQILDLARVIDPKISNLEQIKQNISLFETLDPIVKEKLENFKQPSDKSQTKNNQHNLQIYIDLIQLKTCVAQYIEYYQNGNIDSRDFF